MPVITFSEEAFLAVCEALEEAINGQDFMVGYAAKRFGTDSTQYKSAAEVSQRFIQAAKEIQAANVVPPQAPSCKTNR